MSATHTAAVSRADFTGTNIPTDQQAGCKSVLKVLADYSNEDGYTAVSSRTIALESGCVDTEMDTAIRTLVDAKLVEVLGLVRAGTAFVLNADLLRTLKVPSGAEFGGGW